MFQTIFQSDYVYSPNSDLFIQILPDYAKWPLIMSVKIYMWFGWVVMVDMFWTEQTQHVKVKEPVSFSSMLDVGLWHMLVVYSGYGKYSDPLKFFTLCYIAAIC